MKLTKLLFIGLLFASAAHAGDPYSSYNTSSTLPQQLPTVPINPPPLLPPPPIVSPIQSPPVGPLPTLPKDWNEKWVNKEK